MRKKRKKEVKLAIKSHEQQHVFYSCLISKTKALDVFLQLTLLFSWVQAVLRMMMMIMNNDGDDYFIYFILTFYFFWDDLPTWPSACHGICSTGPSGTSLPARVSNVIIIIIIIITIIIIIIITIIIAIIMSSSIIIFIIRIIIINECEKIEEILNSSSLLSLFYIWIVYHC